MNAPGAIDMSPQYRVMTWLVWMVFCTRGKLIVHGREHLPPRPYIVAPNHISNWDPVAIGLALFHEQIHPLGKQELFEIPVLGKLPPWFGGIPVRRGAVDRDTIKLCREVLAQRHTLMILPEGTRSRTGGLKQGKPGIIFLAQLAQVPIVPVGVWGTETLSLGRPWQPHPVHVRFGPPVYVGRSKADRESGLDTLMNAIARLLPPSYRGDYA